MARLLKRVALALLVPLLLFGGGEVALRLLRVGYPTTFLTRANVGGRSRWVDNIFYGYRFFPPRLSRTTMPIVMDRTPELGAIRIYILGESAAMGEPQAEFGPARWLETILHARYPNQRFEVINAAMTAINSYVIADIARELSYFSPAAFILYMGNNEVVGPYGPGTVFEWPVEWPGVNALRVTASSLRLAGPLNRALHRDDGSAHWTGMDMFESRRVAPDDNRMPRVYSEFRRNLRRILAAARRGDAKVALSTVAVNLAGCAPFAGDQARQNFAAAARAANADERWHLLESARDQDELRFRADSTINQIIRDVANETPVTFVDADRAFVQLQRGGSAPEDLFVDHVHFAAEGNYRLAMLWADALTNLPALQGLAPAETPAPETCLKSMLFSPWSERELVEALIQRRSHAPFLDQPGNAALLARWHQRRATLLAAIAQQDLPTWRERYETELREHPDDTRLISQYADILLNIGAIQDAERWLRAQLDREPHRLDARGALALDLGYQGRSREALELFVNAPRPTGAFPADLLVGNARILSRDGHPEAALTFAAEAARLAPDAPDIQIEYAAQLAAAGRDSEAERLYRSTFEKHPKSALALEEWAAWNVMRGSIPNALRILDEAGQTRPGDESLALKRAQILTIAGQLDDAEKALREILARNPNSFEALYQMGVLAVRRGDLEGGAAEFEHALNVREDARAFYQLSRICRQQKREAAALQNLEAAVQWGGDRPEYLRALAWMLATSSKSDSEDAARALELAQLALATGGDRDAAALDTLAAALAASGEFAEAQKMADLALQAAGSSPAAEEIAKRRDLYAKGEPYREP